MLVARTVQACLPIFLVAFCRPLHAGVLTALGIDQINYTPPEDAAKQDIERWKKEDAMYETAKQLVDFAVKAHMEMFGAKYSINSAAQRNE